MDFIDKISGVTAVFGSPEHGASSLVYPKDLKNSIS